MTHADHAVTTHDVEAYLRVHFSGFEPKDYGSSSVEYVVANVRDAVLCDLLLILEDRLSTMESASHMTKFSQDIPERDWEVAKSHLVELISEIKQYKIKGVSGYHTGPLEVVNPTEEHE